MNMPRDQRGWDSRQEQRRVAHLNNEIEQLRHRRDALLLALDVEAGTPDEAALAEVRQHIAEIIATADLPERQALCEALIEALQVGANSVATPVLRVPDPQAAPPSQRTGTGAPAVASGA
jgi:hypothetical protein